MIDWIAPIAGVVVGDAFDELDANSNPNYRWHFFTLGMSIVDASISPSTANFEERYQKEMREVEI